MTAQAPPRSLLPSQKNPHTSSQSQNQNQNQNWGQNPTRKRNCSPSQTTRRPKSTGQKRASSRSPASAPKTRASALSSASTPPPSPRPASPTSTLSCPRRRPSSSTAPHSPPPRRAPRHGRTSAPSPPTHSPSASARIPACSASLLPRAVYTRSHHPTRQRPPLPAPSVEAARWRTAPLVCLSARRGDLLLLLAVVTVTVTVPVLVLVLVFLDKALWQVRCSNKNLPHPNLEFRALLARWNSKVLGSAGVVPVLGVGEVCCLGDAGGVWGGSVS
ncbi:hypothetical protein EDB87DRAFT_901954 [Lactarius vividus]|nr:hypothetical protein EDB87DRAFT_901954 [Lactarius vividus]